MNKEESIWSKLVDVVQIIDAKLSRIEVDSKAIRKDLKYHIHRTNKLEEHVTGMEDGVLRPVQKDMLKFKIVGGIIVTIGLGLCGLIGWLINTLLTLYNMGIIPK